MNENDENKKPEDEDIKKTLYSYSECEDSLNVFGLRNVSDNSNNSFNYQYSSEVENNNDNVNASKGDRIFTLCIIASCLNFAFVVLFFIYNFENAVSGVTYFGGKFIFSYNSLRFLLIFLILFILSIASIVFLFLYRRSKFIGMAGILVCGVVCFICLFLQFLTVIIQLALYISAMVLFFNNYIRNKLTFNQSI